MHKSRNLYFLVFYFLLSTIAIAQKEIMVTGTITNEQNQPVPYIDVVLKSIDSLNLVIGFSVTDNFGRFKIIVQTKSDRLLLETSSLVHETAIKPIIINKNNLFLNENFHLKNRVEELQEFEITATPRVIIRNDTTIFNLEKLTNGTERVVEEILKKLPGVVIDESGRLKFKGKDVEKVLLDGDNLFDGNYTIGTKRINASFIKGIEAIENFEENSLLQGLSENDQVALNLKFGEGVSLSGDAELSYANGNRLSSNTTAIVVSKPLKGFGIASFNSIGNDLENTNFDATEFIDRLREQHSNGLDAPSFIGHNNGLFPDNNSISNNEYFGSLNLLPKLSDTETLRLNLDALSDQSLEQRTSLTLIGNDTNNPLRIEEKNKNLIKPLYFNSSAYFQKFSSPSNSWSTNIKISKLKNEKQLLGIRNEQEQEENSIFKELFLSNNTIYTHRIDEKRAIKIEGLAILSEKSEYLTLFSGIDFNSYTPIADTNNEQNVHSKKKQVQFLTNYYQKIRENDKLNLKMKIINFKNSLMSTLTSTDESVAFENIIDYEVFVPEITADYIFKQANISLRPILTAKLYSYNYFDEMISSNRNNSKLLLDASIRSKYELNKRNSFTTSFEHLNEIPSEEILYTNFILRSNRIIEKSELNFQNLTSDALGLFYNYNNLIKDTNLSLSFIYKKDHNTYLSSNNINNYINIVTNIGQGNVSENRIWNLSFLKYISVLRSTIRFNSSYNNSNYINFLNGSEMRYNKMELLNANLAIGTSFIGKFLFGNKLTYTQTKFSRPNFQGLINQGIMNKFDITYVPNDNLRIDTYINYIIPNLDNSQNHTLTFNSSITYQNKKKTISYILEGRNLLNQSQIGNIKNTDFSTTITSESLFDRLILFTVNFKY